MQEQSIMFIGVLGNFPHGLLHGHIDLVMMFILDVRLARA